MLKRSYTQKTHMSSVISPTLWLLIVIVGISACYKQPEMPPQSDKSIQTEPTALTAQPSNDIDFREALGLMFDSPEITLSDNLGKDTVAAITSVQWSTFSGLNPCEPIPPPPSSDNRLRFGCIRIILAEPYRQLGSDKFLILTESILTGECHPCSPNISGATFSKKADSWSLDFKHLEFLSLGHWGSAPPTELVKIGQERFGVFFHNNDTSTGIFSGEIVLITKLDGEFKVILQTETAYGYFEEGWQYDSEIFIIEKSDQEWYDIQLTTNGTRPSNSNPTSNMPFEEVRIFSWNGSSYEMK